MEERVYKELSKIEQTAFHTDLLNHVKGLVDFSRSTMVKYYTEWDRHDDIYEGVTQPDKEDKLAANRKEPVKSVIPVTKAQVDAFVAFAFSTLMQREWFFELLPFGSDNVKAAAIGSALLQRDLDHSNVSALLFQFLQDIGKFGIAILKNNWEEQFQWVDETIDPKRFEFLGITVPLGIAKKVTNKKMKWQGNVVRNISPYRFFPDPRYPVCDFQRGEFVASEDEMSIVELMGLQADRMVAGVQHVEAFNDGRMSEMRKMARMRFVDVSQSSERVFLGDKGGSAAITESVVKLIPSNWKMLDGLPLAEEDRPVKYLVWYANDNRIIRLEPFVAGHDQFPYTVGELSKDQHHFIKSGIAGTLDQLQDIISWFINSHITSVRKVISNKLVIDPEGIEMDDIKERRPVIRLKPGMSRSGVDRWIKQLEVHDVTASHVQDAKMLHDIVQVVTGINENALGQYAPGRRSALEARNVNSSVAARLKTTISVVYYSALEPLGRQMLANLREGLSMETFVRLWGIAEDPTKFFSIAKVSGADLVGDFDFEIFDGTSPTERLSQAATLQEVLAGMMANPQLAMMLGLDVKEMLFETLRLKGIRHPEHFTMGFEEQIQMMKTMTAMQLLQGQNNGPNNGTPTGPETGGGVQSRNGGGQAPPPNGMAGPPGLPLLSPSPQPRAV